MIPKDDVIIAVVPALEVGVDYATEVVGSIPDVPASFLEKKSLFVKIVTLNKSVGTSVWSTGSYICVTAFNRGWLQTTSRAPTCQCRQSVEK